MTTILVYLFTVFSSFFLGTFTTMSLGFFGTGEIGIINSALIGSSITVGIVAGKCLRSLSEHQFSFKAMFFAVLCYALPALALVTNYMFTSFPGNVLAIALKYIYAVLFAIIGIIPGMLVKIVYLVIKSSEEVAAGIAILIFLVVPTFEGVILGGSIVDKINPYIGPAADGMIEDEHGNTHYIYFHK